MAVANPSDQDHTRASQAYEQAVTGGWFLYTTNWTLYDALSHLKERQKSGGLAAAKHLQGLLRSAISVIPITTKREERATFMFWTMEDKVWSVTTCANMVVMKELEIQFVLSGNHHYRQGGFSTLY